MKWDRFLGNVKEEINKPSISRKGKKISLIEQISGEMSSSKVDEAMGDIIKKVSGSIKQGWKKITNKIKEVATRGFRFGIAIAKDMSGKFFMFNKKGDILIPPANNISYKKTSFAPSVLTVEYKTKAGSTDVYLSDTLDFGFGVNLSGPKGFGIINVIEPKGATVTEGVDYKLSKKIKRLIEAEEDESKDEDELKARFESGVNKLVFSGGTSALEKSEDSSEKVRPVVVNYGHFKKMLTEAMDRVKGGKTISGGMIKNIAIYAPTGWGKSMIIKQVADQKGFHYLPLELQKISLEVVQGFPYLDKIEDAGEDIKSDRIKRAQTIVKLAPSQYLPPSGDVDNWLLFFDEFNRADTEKMAAVMNLLLTGELGGAAEMIRKGGKVTKIEKYRLPKNIVIVLAMNTGEQKNIYEATNAVNNLDIATLERIQEVVFGKYDAASWYDSFAGKKSVVEFEDGEKLPVISRVPAILLNYISKLTKKATGDADTDPMEVPFLLPISVAGGKGGGGARTMSPRAWTMVADHMIEVGYDNFTKLSDEQKSKYKPDAELIKKEFEGVKKVTSTSNNQVDPPKDVDSYLFAAYMADSQTQALLMSLQASHFGDGGEEVVYDVIRDYKKKLKEGVSHYDILFNYKSVRSIVRKNFSNLGFGTMPRFLAQLLYSLSTFNSVEDISTFMKKNKWEMLPTVDSVEEQLLKTFQAIKKDLDIPDDDFAAFLHLIDDLAKKGNPVIRKIHQKAVGEGWTEYEDALKTKLKTKSQVEKELESLFGAEESSKEKGKSKSKKKDVEESMDMFKFFRALDRGGVK